jgi:hypothetical protein
LSVVAGTGLPELGSSPLAIEDLALCEELERGGGGVGVNVSETKQ